MLLFKLQFFFFLFNISYKISVLLLYLGICVIWYVWMFVSNACVSHGLSYCFCTMHLKLNEKYLWILIYGVNFIEVAELFLYLLHVYFFWIIFKFVLFGFWFFESLLFKIFFCCKNFAVRLSLFQIAGAKSGVTNRSQILKPYQLV